MLAPLTSQFTSEVSAMPHVYPHTDQDVYCGQIKHSKSFTMAAATDAFDFPQAVGILERIVVDVGTLTDHVDLAFTDGDTGETIFAKTSISSDLVERPSILLQKTDGTDTTQYARFHLLGALHLDIANAHVGDTFTVTIFTVPA